MNAIDNMMIRAKNKIVKLKAKAVKKERGDETLVIKVMLIVIAVALGLMFRNTIGDIITSLLASAKTSIDGMFTEYTAPGV